MRTCPVLAVDSQTKLVFIHQPHLEGVSVVPDAVRRVMVLAAEVSVVVDGAGSGCDRSIAERAMPNVVVLSQSVTRRPSTGNVPLCKGGRLTSTPVISTISFVTKKDFPIL